MRSPVSLRLLIRAAAERIEPLSSLPLFPFMYIAMTPLARHSLAIE
jgi:muconolactone delta-isomerase